MPPQYKFYEPLPVTNYAGLPKELFNTPPVNFQADYNAALQDKQTLEGGQLALEQKQRAAAMDKAQVDALIAQYGGANAGQPLDPAAISETIARNAMQHGDANRALEAVKQGRQFKLDRAVDEPLSEEMRLVYERQMGMPLPKGISLSGIDRLLRSQGLGISADKAQTYRSQFEFNKERYDRTMASFAPGGFEPDVDPVTKQGPTDLDGKLFTESAVAHSRLHSDLDMLEAALSIPGGNDPRSPIFTRQKSILSDILIALKEKNNFGAALTGLEAKYNAAGLPQVLARPDVGLTEAVVAAGLGRDPMQLINDMRSLLSTDFDQQRVLYKFKRREGTVGLPAALSGTSFRLPMSNPAGAAAVPPNAQPRPSGPPAPQPTPSGPPAPQQQQEGDLSPEEQAEVDRMAQEMIAQSRAQRGR